MRRDINLIREVLKSYNARITIPLEYDMETVQYHIDLCKDAGFILEDNLTESGISFLNTFEDDDIWNETLVNMQKNGFDGLPVEVLEKLYKKIELLSNP
jgi:hypothetical protein